MSMLYEEKSQSIIEHLIELRTRLIWSLVFFLIAFLFCFHFSKQLFNYMLIPYKWAVLLAKADISKSQLIYTAPQEFFLTQIKIGMFGALVISFPVFVTHIYKFIAPGLYKNERSAFLPFLIVAPILFSLGTILVYFFFIPMVMCLFLSMQQYPENGLLPISMLPRVSEYLELFMSLVFCFGLIFQLPVLITLLARVEMVSSEFLVKKRKIAIVIVFIVAAIITPPDPLSQIGLALPTILLYEISIFSAKFVERKRNQRKTDGNISKDISGKA
ncbi:preprotein translocase subunit TatC [Liberibacter crescens]|nr:twin-arginine translocase subunit TatC [Liberibacter crescens]AMC13405.1 preprotein translocase subunit TatC [Liberibacter crescens]